MREQAADFQAALSVVFERKGGGRQMTNGPSIGPNLEITVVWIPCKFFKSRFGIESVYLAGTTV